MKNLFKTFLGLVSFSLIVFGLAFVFLPLPGTIPVLMYHFIDTRERATKEKNVVSQESFERQMQFLDRFGYRVISPDEFYAIKTGRKKPLGKEVVLTLDDGNYTFEEKAFPILQKYSFPVAVFVVSESVKQELHGSMTVASLKKLLASGKVTIGSHTKTHPLLSQMSDQQMKEELEGSKRDLETLLGTPITDLAYPSGDFDGKVLEKAKQAGYRLAFTTSYKQLKGIEEDLYSITRLKISRTSDNLLVFWLKLSGIYQTLKHSRHQWKNQYRNL
jgi:peptidoglycan/xylan/chitin deacetylase (PgdA/CDA1 family)